MPDPITQGGSVSAGSPTPGPASNAAPQASHGQPGQQTGNAAELTVPKSTYDELFSKFGTQGNELGKYREFFQNITPLLDKLDENPELVQGILDGKIDKDLAKAVLEGRVNVDGAQAVQQAHQQIQREVGKEALANMTPHQVEKLVEDKAKEILKGMTEKAEFDAFQQSTRQFIETTPDFATHAEEIDKWLDEHPEITDVKVAYFAVKGQLSTSAAKKAADEAAAERAKDIALNASGGGVTAQHISGSSNIVDQLISGRPNPNNLF